jgi:hypothetical protein
MRVGARKGFSYHSVKLVLMPNGNRYEVDSNTFFKVVKPSNPVKIVTCSKSDLFLPTSLSVVCAPNAHSKVNTFCDDSFPNELQSTDLLQILVCFSNLLSKLHIMCFSCRLT